VGQNTTISWDKNDKIKVNGVELSIQKLENGMATFAGGGEVTKKGGYYEALYYPNNLEALDASDITWGDGTLSFPFPQTQSYAGDMVANLVPMVAVSETTNLSFKSACSILDFKLKGDGFLVGKIVVSSTTNALTGSVSMANGGTLSFTANADSTKSSITLNVPADSTLTLSGSNAKHVCVLVPTITTSTTLTVQIYKKGQESGLPYSSGEITVGGSATLDFGDLTRVSANIVPDQLPGLFSVSATKQVRFSKGNLQYKKDGDIWRFAPEQWYHYSKKNNPQSDGGNFTRNDSKWIDLFGWGTSGFKESPMLYSEDNTKYHGYRSNISNTAYDWGVFNFIDEGWRTLTKDEWIYLFGRSGKWSTGTIQIDSTQTDRSLSGGIEGIILLPDDFLDPNTNIYWVSGDKKENDHFYPGTHGSSTFHFNRYTYWGWRMMEKQGAVFLPKVCARKNQTEQYEDYGDYWTSTVYENGSYTRYAYAFRTINQIGSNHDKFYGHAVRLVKNATVDPQPQSGDYIDEYGYNRGQGIVKSGVTYAPVNCGFAEPGLYDKNKKEFLADNHEDGKLYQWGRKDGQGHADCDKTTTPWKIGSYTIYQGVCESDSPDPNVFYYPGSGVAEWTTNTTSDSWPSNANPCPSGWHVPTSSELGSIGSSIQTAPKYYRYNTDLSIGISYFIYWSSESAIESGVYKGKAKAYHSGSGNGQPWQKSYGFKVRCVKDI